MLKIISAPRNNYFCSFVPRNGKRIKTCLVKNFVPGKIDLEQKQEIERSNFSFLETNFSFLFFFLLFSSPLFFSFLSFFFLLAGHSPWPWLATSRREPATSPERCWPLATPSHGEAQPRQARARSSLADGLVRLRRACRTSPSRSPATSDRPQRRKKERREKRKKKKRKHIKTLKN